MDIALSLDSLLLTAIKAVFVSTKYKISWDSDPFKTVSKALGPVTERSIAIVRVTVWATTIGIVRTKVSIMLVSLL